MAPTGSASSDNSTASHQETGAIKSDRSSPRRSTLVFVVVFLTSTFALLTAYRYAQATPAMNWYLFHVGKYTAWTLNQITYMGRLEQAGNFDGQEDLIRAKTKAWLQGKEVEPFPEGVSPAGSALTDWEHYQYRVAKNIRELKWETQAIQALSAPRPEVIASKEEHIAYVRSLVSMLEKSIQRPSEISVSIIEVAPQDVKAGFKSAKVNLDAFFANPPSDGNEFGKTLTAIQETLEGLRRRQTPFVIERSVRLKKGLVECGPIISTILHPSLARQIADLSARLDSVQRDTAISDETRKSQLDRLDGRIADLRASQARLKESNPGVKNADSDQSFRFKVVPDCGALESMGIFFSALLAFPTMWRRKLIGATLGIPILYAVNVLRLTCLGLIGAAWGGGEIFDFAHHYAWQGIYIVFVVAVWLLWMELIVKRGEDLFSRPVVRNSMAFMGKFAVFAPVTAMIWWMLIPAYLVVVGNTTAITLRYVFQKPVQSVRVERSVGVEQSSVLEFPELLYMVDNKEKPLKDAWSLASTLAPFVALMLATGGMTLRQRLRRSGIGAAVLVFSHFLYIILVFLFENQIREAPEIPTAVSQIFITLPFLLWLLLVMLGRALPRTAISRSESS